ncbi:MAG: UvrD-helicase domain-containing protein [Lachnospiraceae bacterium]|nr:UvrD-helicase domain-containing protein [Lachnospiraceae bacterium]
MEDLLENLNERQREAVLETEGYVRVIAGAGSGKTKLLVSRYAYLVQDYGIDSSNILCVTFTNKAAGEMKKRIRALIGDHNDTSLICTYHGFCNRLLRENPEKLFLNQQFQIIDAQQQKSVLGEIYQKFELKLDYASFESILRKIGYVKRDTDYVTRMCNPEPCRILQEIKNQDDQIIEEFLQRQKATYSLDFHDLISFAIHLLENDSKVREKWQNRLNYIMVDEFQDSSGVEMRLVELLSGLFQNLMIVGDPDQNIYEWRGSDVKLLVDFDKGHEPTKTIILNQNYRSTPQILNCANTLIEKNELRLKKDLFTKNAPGSAVVHYHSKSDFEEMDRVIENIKRLHDREGLRYSDFAVIYRSGFLSRVAEKKLVEKNIPYEIFGGVRFYQRMEILDVLAYLKLIAYGDDVSFRRIVNTPRRRFGRAKMNLLEQLRDAETAGSAERMYPEQPGNRETAGSAGRMCPEGSEGFRHAMSLYGRAEGQEAQQAYGAKAAEANRSAGTAEYPGNRVSRAQDGRGGKNSLYVTLCAHRNDREFVNSDIASFIGFVETMRESIGTKRISDIVNEVTRDSGYEAYIRELGDEERLDNLAEFKRIANEFEREFGENLDLEQFLQQVALQSGEDAGEGRDTVKLMTIHSSKGLEFPAVFILGFTEGIFPSAKTIGERKKLGLEEERRLCYVAITRAEKYLFLMDSEGTSPNGIKKLVSRFLTEIGEENYVRIGQISDDLRRESRSYTEKLNSELYVEETGSRKAGDVVEHHIFGRGTIEAVDEKRGSYLVRFDGLKQARNISAGYFARGHEDTGTKKYAGQDRAAGIVQAAGKADTEAQRSAAAEVLQLKKVAQAKGGMVQKGEQAANGAESVNKTGAAQDTGEAGSDRKVAQAAEMNGETARIEKKAASKAGRKKTAEDIQTVIKTVVGQELEKVKKAAKALEKEFVSVLPAEMQASRRENTVLEGTDTNTSANASGKTFASSPDNGRISAAQAARVQALKEASPNLWKRDDVPHTGWNCTGISDLGAPIGICEMCGYQIIRYAHHMEHPQYRNLTAGCVCAGKMEGDLAGAKQREAEFKNRQARRVNFFKRKWKQSKKGNEYLKIDDHVVVIYHNADSGNIWKYSIDNQFCRNTYATRERALAAAFDALELLRVRR